MSGDLIRSYLLRFGYGHGEGGLQREPLAVNQAAVREPRLPGSNSSAPTWRPHRGSVLEMAFCLQFGEKPSP